VDRPLVSSCALALIVALAPPARVFGQQQATQGQSQQSSQAQNSHQQSQSPNSNSAQGQPQAGQPQGANEAQHQPQAGQPQGANNAQDQPQAGQPQGANNAQGQNQANQQPNANNPQGQAQANQQGNTSNCPSGTGMVSPNMYSWVVPGLNGSQNAGLQYGWQDIRQQAQPQSFAFYWVDQASRNSGMTLAPADAALRAHLKLPEDEGLIVTAVEPGSPAGAVGIQPNDVLIRVYHDPNRSYYLAKPEDLEGALKNVGERPITIDLLRGGQKVTVKVQPKIHASLGPVRPEPNPYRIGVSVGPVEPALRAQLQLPEQQGLIVLEVEKDGPAARAGVRQFDILRKFDGVDLVDQAGLTKLVQSRADKTVVVELLREGKPLEIKIAPQLRQVSLNVLRDPNAGGTWDLVFTNPIVASPNPNNVAFTPQTWANDVVVFRTNDGGAAGNASGNTNAKADPGASVEKKIDELTAQIKELRQAIDALAKSQPKK
jgi:membrane-associated protease RseP (regulator of RpoE activity)